MTKSKISKKGRNTKKARKPKKSHTPKKARKPKRSLKRKPKMKGGSIPFAESTPVSLFDMLSYNIQSALTPLFDYPQIVPDNLKHTVSPKVESQPYLEKTQIDSTPVVGDEPKNFFNY